MPVQYSKIILRHGNKKDLDTSILSLAEPVFIDDSGEIAIKKSDGTLVMFGDNVIELSGISSSNQLNDYIDVNKTYVFSAANYTLRSELKLVGSEMTRFIMNNYIANYGHCQVLRIIAGNIADMNKVFLRFLSNGSQSTFTDITIPDNYITKAKLSDELQSEINWKFNSSDVETGTGKLSTTSARISSADFEYQKVGNYVTVNVYVSFTESSMGATTSIQLTGLPFANKSSGVIRLPIATSAKTSLIAAVGSGTTVNILTSAAVNFSSDETAGFTLSYKIN